MIVPIAIVTSPEPDPRNRLESPLRAMTAPIAKPTKVTHPTFPVLRVMSVPYPNRGSVAVVLTRVGRVGNGSNIIGRYPD